MSTTAETTGDKSPAGSVPALIQSHYIKDFSFENPHAPASLLPSAEKSDIQVEFGLNYRKLAETQEGSQYEVVIGVHAKATRGAQISFVIELEYATVCLVQGVPEQHVEAFLLTEIPHIAFPFVRQIVADTTARAGYAPFYLQPVNFVRLYQAQRQRAEAEAGPDLAAAE